jgi:hypothetical protein
MLLIALALLSRLLGCCVACVTPAEGEAPVAKAEEEARDDRGERAGFRGGWKKGSENGVEGCC